MKSTEEVSPNLLELRIVKAILNVSKGDPSSRKAWGVNEAMRQTYAD
ncbi:MAG: hypothetical protein QW733_04635 [Desulfurococcaceae archaeon]